MMSYYLWPYPLDHQFYSLQSIFRACRFTEPLAALIEDEENP